MKKDRYSRQINLPEIGIEGQNKIKSSRVLCVGVGGLGSPIALYLAAAGVGTIGLIDLDHVDESNLQRQVLFRNTDQGKNKVDAAQKNLNELNPGIRIFTHHEEFNSLNAEEILFNYDLVIDGSDNFGTKFLINDAAYKRNIPLIYGAISGFEGEVAFFWGNKGACYRCFHPEPPKAQIRNCAQAGVLGSVAGVIGSLQATLALQFLATGGDHTHPLFPAIGQLSVFSFAGAWSMRNLMINKNSDCPTCSHAPAEVKLTFNTEFCFKIPTVQSHELLKLMNVNKKNILLLDVRETEEWDLGYINGAIHWPLAKLRDGLLPTAVANMEKVIVYCKAGIRSEQAVEILIKAGITQSYSLVGGFDSFTQA